MPDLLEKLQGANAELDVVEKGLNDFLDTKKLAFPRFFFLSNDELLEILSEAKDPLQGPAVHEEVLRGGEGVEFTNDHDARDALRGGRGVPLSKEIDPAETGAVEMWMLEFEDVMKESMREVTAKSIAEYATVSREEWILDWPGQVVIAGSQVYWTHEVTDAIVADGPKGLAAYGEKCNAQLDQHRQHGARRAEQARARDDERARDHRRPRERRRRADGGGRRERRRATSSGSRS